MNFYQEILFHLLCNEKKYLSSSNFDETIPEMVERECFKALKKIKEILEDDSLSDEECFLKIEEIVCVFEARGSNAGNRHDF